MKRMLEFLLLVTAVFFIAVSCSKSPKSGAEIPKGADTPDTTGIPDDSGKSNTVIPKAGNTVLLPGEVVRPVYPEGISINDFDGRRTIRESNPVDEEFLNSVKDFSYRTASEIIAGTSGNIIYSPLSLYYALSLACSGAGSENDPELTVTKQELLNILGMDSAEELSAQCGNLYRLLYREDEVSTLRIANSIWLGQDRIFHDRFKENAASNFYSSLFNADFTDAKTADIMARWVSENTSGKIKPVFEFNAEQIMSILNTVYFYDEWMNRFDEEKTMEDIFYKPDGTEVSCDFMNMTFGSHGFTIGDGFLSSSLNLKNSGSMVFILPDAGVDPHDLMSDPETVRRIFSREDAICGEVVFKVPKFSYGSRLNLKEALKRLGINEAFEKNADFRNMTDGIAYISDISQETHITIDEKGVEAAAFTRIDYTGDALPEGRAEMILNRPFIYGIISYSGTPLFIGICEDPADTSSVTVNADAALNSNYADSDYSR